MMKDMRFPSRNDDPPPLPTHTNTQYGAWMNHVSRQNESRQRLQQMSIAS